MIVAIVQEFMAQHVIDALHALPGVSGATVSAASGFGRGRARGARGPDEEDLLGTVPKTRVEVVVRDEHAVAVVAAMQRAAHTGQRGDGKIFVLPVDHVLRISTGEEGDHAV